MTDIDENILNTESIPNTKASIVNTKSSILNTQPSIAVPVKEIPKFDLKNELTTYFFHSMLNIIVDSWEGFVSETTDSIASKEKILTPTEKYVRVCENDTTSINSLESQGTYSFSLVSAAESTYTLVSPADSHDNSYKKNSKKRYNQSELKIKKILKKKRPVIISDIFIPQELQDNQEFYDQTRSEMDWVINPIFEFATITFRNGNRYEGSVFGKLMQGHGTFYWADGSKYTGEFENGHMTGKGVIQYSDGCRYDGQIYKNYRHGIGRLYKADSSAMYHGEWQAGEKHGHGWQLFEPNNWYDGEWKNNYMSGNGLRIYSSGTQYQGNFDKNNRHGTGCAVMYNNDLYVGEWVQGVRQGFGEYTWNAFFNTNFTVPIHNKYNGVWANNNMHGFGLLHFGLHGGIRYIGQFKDSLKHGSGIIVCQNGSIIESNPLFVNDKPVHYKSTASLDLSAYFKSNEQSELEDQKDRSDSESHSIRTEFIGHDDENLPYSESVLNILRKLSAFKFGITKDLLADVDICKLGFPQHKQNNQSIMIPIHLPCEQIELNFFICKVISMVREKCTTVYSKIFSKYGSNCTDARRHSTTWDSFTSEQKIAINSQSDMCDQHYIEEEKLMRRAINAHVAKLWQIYHQYANVACLKVLPFKTWMMRICLWQMYRDFKVPEKGISLIDIDKMLSDRMCFDNDSIHYPFEIIYFWQYLHSLIRIAWELYGKEFTGNENNENGMLKNAFLKFLENDVFPNCGQHTGSVLFDYIDVLPMGSVYELYKSIGEPHTALALLRYCCTENRNNIPAYYKVSTSTKIPPIQYGVNAAPFSDRVAYLPQEPPHLESESPHPENIPASNHDYFLHKLVFLRSLGPKTILSFIKQICPAVGQNKSIVNIEYPLTFIEFYDIILMCSQRLIDIERENIEKIRISEYNKLISVEERVLKQEAETVVSWEKGVKKKGKLVKTHSKTK